MKGLFINLKFVLKQKKKEEGFVFILFCPDTCVWVSGHARADFRKAPQPHGFHALYLILLKIAGQAFSTIKLHPNRVFLKSLAAKLI